MKHVSRLEQASGILTFQVCEGQLVVVDFRYDGNAQRRKEAFKDSNDDSAAISSSLLIRFIEHAKIPAKKQAYKEAFR